MKTKKSLESLKNNKKFNTIKQYQKNDIKGGGDTFTYTIIVILEAAAAELEVEVIDIYY